MKLIPKLVSRVVMLSIALTAITARSSFAQVQVAAATTQTISAVESKPLTQANPFILSLVQQLELEKYKASIKALTQFGDRRQGTERNRQALNWIEAQLKSYGCSNVERLQYQYTQAAPNTPTAPRKAIVSSGGGLGGPAGQGGSTLFGHRAKTGVNIDPLLQPNEKLRTLNAEATPSGTSVREDVYCTKIGKTHPEEMYIVGAHMDGIGFGEAANDNGSGTALVLELARIFSDPKMETDRSIRFALWNNEETGLQGASAYVEQRQNLQGIESPVGSGKYPEPKWLGMIQHDMMLWDHGMPVPQLDAHGKPVLDPQGKIIYVSPPEQRREADVNIEYQAKAKQAEGAAKLAWLFRAANDQYATDYPAAVGFHMTNTDSVPFMDIVPAISLRENERGMQIGAGWDPNWHQPSDVYSTYSDQDFRLGLNAAQTTLSAIAELVGAKQKQP